MMRWLNGYQGYSGYGLMGNFGWFGMFICLLIVVLIIIGIVYLVRGGLNRTNKLNRDVTNNRSLDILKERFAKGEITKEEYDVIKKSL